jgi:hypothetical protein
MSSKNILSNKIASWAAAAAYLDSHPSIHLYCLGSYSSIRYVLIRTQIQGVYHQLKYDGTKLVSSTLMDTAMNTRNIDIV